MRSVQVRATQLQDATEAQLGVVRARAGELRLRSGRRFTTKILTERHPDPVLPPRTDAMKVPQTRTP